MAQARLSLAISILQIINSVSHVSASGFVQWCAALGLEPTQPQRDPEPPGFPHYDAAHSFAFKTDDRARAIFDLLAYRDCIIQVRLSVFYHRALFGLLPSKRAAHVRVVLPILVGRYGPPRRMPSMPSMRIFGDAETDAYLSRIEMGRRREMLVVNVGDRAVWKLAGGVVMMVEP
jgi:hypothetical protein